MATVLLSAAGSAIGGSIGGSVLGIGAAALGQAVGATVGGIVDNAILGGGGKPVELGKRDSIRLPTTSEGAAITRIIGRMRTGGQLLWSTRFRENVTRTTQGGKGGPSQTVKTYSYTISFAVGICEGRIDRIGRVWADGQPFDLQGVNYRLYTGTADQMPDEKIEAVEGAGNVPAYRGLAYVVFEDFPVSGFGNRIPVLNFEVFRSPNVTPEVAAAQGFEPPVRDLVQAVCLSPGTGEFALETQPVRHNHAAGTGRYVNVNNSAGVPDLAASLDQLEGDLPGCDAVSLIVSWFGDDLRCDRCQIMPRIEEAGRTSWPYSWSAAGLSVATAPEVSRDAEGRPNYGGTPADRSVIASIKEMAARGKKVMFYPFILMDVPPGNTLADPHGGPAQPPFPWRGRITLSVAPGEAGSPDQTSAAVAEVSAFFGTATAADFSVVGENVSYTGPAEWGFRRFILHMAALAKAAGGVEAFCIGSELRGLTTIRSDRTTFPAVAELKALVAEVRQLLPDADLGYAADWSEYFGHQPQDGTGDVLFHLDPLWSDPEIDFVGIDNYVPLSDWRAEGDHLDAGSYSGVHQLDYLRANIEGGEGYDWYYPDQAARNGQARAPITDGAHGEDWVYRYKDFRNWWLNAHHERVDGVRSATPTAWVPKSKPIWFTEVGCPAVDLGANEPNAFVDPLSSESRLPHFSRGARDDLMQARFLQAVISYWSDPANNPVSDVYTGRMIREDRMFVWTWDARPWPDFPLRETLWKDGPNFSVGHWLPGRVSSSALAEAVAEITQVSVPDNLDLRALDGLLDGLIVDGFEGPREVLQSLIVTHDFEVRQSGDRLHFVPRRSAARRDVPRDLIVAGDGEAPSSLTYEIEPETGARSAVQLYFTRGEVDFRTGTAEASLSGDRGHRVDRVSVPVSLSGARAREVAARVAVAGEVGKWRAQVELPLPLSTVELEAGDEIDLPVADGTRRFRIERVREGLTRRVDAVAVGAAPVLSRVTEDRGIEPPVVAPPAPMEAVFLDLPLASGAPEDGWPLIAVHADPWPGEAIVWRSANGETFEELMRVRARAVIGTTETALEPGVAGRWQRASVEVALASDGLESVTEAGVLNGANRAALEWPDGWEIVQFRDAELVAPGLWRLSNLLRGQRDTARDGVLPAGARFVLLDEAAVPLPMPAELRGLERHYRVAAASVGPEHFSAAAEQAAFDQVGLRPFAPVHLRVRSSGGDLEVSWIRRTRIGGLSWQGPDVPLGEMAEAYLVEIVEGGEVLRSVTVTTPAYTYTAADQAADGAGAGASARVRQVSDSYGYGRASEVSLHD